MRWGLWLCSLLSVQALANEALQFSGFGSIGIVTSDSADFGYRRDYSRTTAVFDGQWDWREHSNIGVQLDWAVSPQWDVVTQLHYRDQVDTDLNGLLNVGFVRYKPQPNFIFRAGRVPFDLFLMTEYRDVDYAYTFAKIPSEIYGIVPHRHLDGLDAEYLSRAADKTYSAKLFYGKTNAQISADNTNSSRDFKMENVFGLVLAAESLDWELAIHHTQVRFDNQYAQPLVDAVTSLEQIFPAFTVLWPDAQQVISQLDLDNKTARYSSIGGQLNVDNITIMSEIAYIRSASETVHDVYSGYAGFISHQESWQWFFNVGFAKTNRTDDLLNNANVTGLAQFQPAFDTYQGARFLNDFYNMNQTTASIGARWNVTDAVALKVQWDHSWIRRQGSGFWQPPVTGGLATREPGEVNVLFLLTSFIF